MLSALDFDIVHVDERLYVDWRDPQDIMAIALGEATPEMAGGANLRRKVARRLLVQQLPQSNPRARAME